MSQKLSEQMASLQEMSAADLSKEWERVHGSPAPRLSANLLRLGLGFKLQELRLGKVNRETRTILRNAAKASETQGGKMPIPRKLTPGTRLVRDWHGNGHTVAVLEKGFEYDGRQWQSLTAIAKAITGTHWNGPRFFGLTGGGS